MRNVGSPPPQFELGVESVKCILPAHPRHQLLRKLNEIERMIAMKNLKAALEMLLPILENDSYNFRALDLFVDLASSSGNPEILLNYFQEHKIELVKIKPDTLLNQAEMDDGDKTNVPDAKLTWG